MRGFASLLQWKACLHAQKTQEMGKQLGLWVGMCGLWGEGEGDLGFCVRGFASLLQRKACLHAQKTQEMAVQGGNV